MPNEGAYGQRLRDRFHLKQAPAFVTKALGKSDIAVTLIKCDAMDNGLTEPIPPEKAFLVTVQMRNCPQHRLSIDGKWVQTAPLQAGVTSIYDLESNPIADGVSPFTTLHFYLPRKALNAVSDAEEWGYVGTIPHNPGVGIGDPILQGLGYALLPSFCDDASERGLFVDHVTVAVAAHVVRTFGTCPQNRRRWVGELDSARNERAKEMLRASLDGDLTINKLAGECGMSPSTFCQAFRRSNGMFPFEWLEVARANTATSNLHKRTTDH